MKKLIALVSLGATLALSGCYNVTYLAKSKQPSLTKTEHDMNFFLFGLVGTGEVRVDQLCAGRGAAKIKTTQSFLQMFLGVITLGIYTPRSAVVTCAQ